MNAYPFAPGAITRHTSRQRQALARWLARWLVRIAVLMAAAPVLGLLAGIAYGALQ